MIIIIVKIYLFPDFITKYEEISNTEVHRMKTSLLLKIKWTALVTFFKIYSFTSWASTNSSFKWIAYFFGHNRWYLSDKFSNFKHHNCTWIHIPFHLSQKKIHPCQTRRSQWLLYRSISILSPDTGVNNTNATNGAHIAEKSKKLIFWKFFSEKICWVYE